MRIGIDLGGTKIEGIALDGSVEIARLRVSTPRGDYDATLGAVVRLVRTLEERAGARGSVGVGIPGTVSPGTGLVKNANSVCLIGRPLKADLERLLDRPVRIANDANCFAVSEAADGAGAGAAVVFGVIVGTGTGAGIVVRGEVLTGPNGIAGEWGHNPLPSPTDEERPGPRCYCGRFGCIETFLSGPGMQADYERATGRRAAAVGDRLRRIRRRSSRSRRARALRIADGARAGRHHQCSRSRRHRARRRHVEHRALVRQRTGVVGATCLCVFCGQRARSHAPRARTSRRRQRRSWCGVAMGGRSCGDGESFTVTRTVKRFADAGVGTKSDGVSRGTPGRGAPARDV